ncbi:uncharacterized protein JCM6883_007507 [Sporobolomyces salmoneus]|uniref:uncharacterized protein n=1 Tax=Sporobolomyces salmoneus TaxID=183962 RepID=UPI00317F594C
MTSASVPINTHSTRIDVINTKQGRILCVADVRGAFSTLNALAAEHNAIAIIHSGDFGFYEPSSLPSISDRTLKHLIQYSSLISPQFRSQLLSPSTSPSQLRQLLSSQNSSNSSDFPLSEFPKLLSGELKFNVPVYTVWGACEDVHILEKIRLAAPSTISVPSDPSSSFSVGAVEPTSAPPSNSDPPSSSPSTYSYSIPNLTVLDEATTRVLNIGGIRLRLFGLGGAVVPHKLFDNGSGNATIAGGMGTMWTTMLQIGELVDTAQKVYDPTETRLLITHASPGREGLISQLSLVLKADLTISAGLHFRYGVSYNEFSVTWDPETFKSKLEASRKAFGEVWDAVKNQVEGVVDDNQKALLANALAVANRVPSQAPVQGGPAAEETAWKNCWNWNLPDAAFGSLVLDIREGRIGSEMKSQGFNFAYRTAPPPSSSSASNPSSTSAAPIAAPTRAPTGPTHQQQQQQQGTQLNATGGGGGRPQSSQFSQNRGFAAPPHHHQSQQRGPRGPGAPGFQQQQTQPAPPPPASNEPTNAAASKKEVSSAPPPNGVSTPPPPPSAPSPTSANATPTAPTGPRHQNRPSSRSNLQQQQSSAPPSTSTPSAPSTAAQDSSSADAKSVPKGSEDTPRADGGEATTTVSSPTSERTPGSGSGRGRGGRGRGGGGGGGSRGRSNGEWRGRGRGGHRQASSGGGGAEGAGTPSTSTSANAGGEGKEA